MKSRWLTLLIVAITTYLVATPSARADGPKTQASAGGKIGTSGASGSSSFEWPELVYGGNAVSVAAPLQLGILAYEPRFRLGLQYDRQWFKPHWLHVGAGVLTDRGDFSTFRLDQCGLEGANLCEVGTVLGFDAWVGYSYKFYLRDLPYLVPIARAGFGFAYFRYPNVGGSREQARTRSWNMGGRVGGGVRLFFTPAFGLGVDVNAQIGMTRHIDQPLGQEEDGSSEFAIGLELLPLVVEYRF